MSMRLLARLAVFAALAAVGARPALAGPASQTPFILVQPDGTPFVARAAGDEWSNRTETLAGFTIVQDQASGTWVYAARAADGRLATTPLVVGRDQPSGLVPRLRAALTAEQAAAIAADVGPAQAPQLGTRRTLVLLVQFSDKTAITTAAQWSSRFFGATASVRDHYAVSSYGQVTIAPATETHGTADDGIVGWLTLPYSHPNTAGSTGAANQQLTRDAILAADPYVNFAAYDTNGNGRLAPGELMLIVIVAGNETSYGGTGGSCSPSVWGHKWSVSSAPTVDGVMAGADGYGQFGEIHCASANPPGQIATIGIMAHEMGHLFGLPDLYDPDDSSEGIGNWSLMATGSWTGLSRPGDSPALLDPWSKSFLGWMSPTMVTGTLVGQNIPASATSNAFYQFRSGSAVPPSGEYFLVENRQKTSYDAALPGAGLLVWHIDEARGGNSSECVPGGTPACTATVHYKVALVQADNLFDLERNADRGDAGDPFPGTTGRTSFAAATTPSSNLWSGAASDASITSISASAMVMTATLSYSAPTSPPGAFSKSAPANGASGQPTALTISWGASSGATLYEYCYDTSNDNACSTWVSAGTGVSAVLSSLSSSTTYYWHVRATNGTGTTYANGSTTAFWSVTTAATGPAAFSKSSPFNGAAGASGNPMLSWGSSSGATSYEFCLDTTNDNACSTSWTPMGTGTAVTIVAAPGTTYHWQVRATGTGGSTLANNGAWWSFRTAGGTPPPLSPNDFNGDGKVDLLFEHQDGSLYAWYMNGPQRLGGGFLSQSPVDPNLGVVGVRDFTGDGKPDLLLQHQQTGTVVLHAMNGTAKVGEQVIPIAPGTPWRVVATGDFNADGFADIVWQHAGAGQFFVWFLTASGGVVGYAGPGGTFAGDYLRNPDTSIVTLGPTTLRVVGSGDANGDGKPDLFTEDDATGALGAWLLDGTLRTSTTPLAPAAVDAAWRIRAVADYDGNGTPDFVWQHITTGALYQWLMNGTALGWGGYLSSPAVNPVWTVVGPR